MQNDIYGEPEVIKIGNVIARVFTPILTDEERNRRQDLAKKAAVSLVLSKKTPPANNGADSCSSYISN